MAVLLPGVMGLWTRTATLRSDIIHQGQVPVPRLVARQRAIGVSMSERQLMRLVDRWAASFVGEVRAVLCAGLETARWVTVADTGARQARSGICIQTGDNHFAC